MTIIAPPAHSIRTSIVERTWTTRGYELDQDRLVHPATLLRYMEQLRWESTAADSRLDLGRLFRDNHYFVVAAQRLQIERDPGLAETLWADLHLGHLGRSSLEFRTLFREGTAEGAPLARGSVTAVQLDSEGRPTPLPDDFVDEAQEHQEESWVDGGTLRTPKPRGEPPDGACEREIVVRPSDLDILEHVNHAVYLAYVDDVRRLCVADDELGRRRIKSATLEYRAEAKQGQQLCCRTWATVEEPRTLSFMIEREGLVICRAALAF
jgi:acyl-CoA thioesterase FadM